ncbi:MULTISPECIES: type II toxin-antitoxin system RelE/ParE family toxin [unclassified Flavobacterium]|uniref:type II toxin-antitoxin system RelE/ParE family toxin n=1 Tax=unclassified Flavobacterium TaxID=196869 RepID=UPI0006ABDED9|nr:MULTISPECIES: type II toxin-antitoxin system RelE/ParE family toxin [unclassified Flavobacterium]KOP40129.1 plasmid stabilization protein [Flavobacterium sp. VMW]OWU91486.1 plasmid stabilization protein [Flavobacterium sp. NLM]
MDIKVHFSKTAEKNLDAVLNFIEARWSKKSKEIYLVKFEKAISIISMNPEVFPKSSINKKYRKCVITKQSSLLYSFGSNEVRIHTVFDTRQDPNKIKKDIK